MNLHLKTPIVVVGMGISGNAAVSLLKTIGYPENQIKTFDNNGTADFRVPQQVLDFGPQTLVVSPGVPLATPWIQSLGKNGVLVTNEMNISLPYLQNEKWIGITGSVGKSTTVALLEAGLSAVDKCGFVGGNFGTPLAHYVSEVLLGKRMRCQWGVLELSSYQLENFNGPHFSASAITYFTPNHMERYSALEDYYKTKWTLTRHSSSPTILNPSSKELIAWSQKQREPHKLANVELVQKFGLKNCSLLGSHNLDNLLVATELALAAQWNTSSIEEMKKYSGLPHRMQNLGVKKDVLYINDSKATTIESVLTAVNGILEQFPKAPKLFLLLGGKDKNLPWEDLQILAKLPSVVPVFFGACGEIAQQKSKLPGECFTNLKLALQFAQSNAKAKDIVMLSPGGTSLDEFKNFEERGRAFANFVNAL